MTHTELKPCPNPWCNSHKTTDLEIRDMERPVVAPSRASSECRVSCPVCPISGPWADTEAEAITAWNTRIEAGAVAELIEALRKAVNRQGFSNEELIDARNALAKFA